MTTVRIFGATKLSQIASRRAICDPSRAVRLFPALLALSSTALIQGFCKWFSIEAHTGPYGSYDNVAYIRECALIENVMEN